MLIIGCDFHTRYQQMAMMDTETGELVERRLEHASGEAEWFYRQLQGPVRVGIEATGPIHWFERLLAGGPPFRIFLVDRRARVNDTTPVRHRRGNGLAFPGGGPLRF